MAFFLRGALVEYGTDFLGPLPNVVIFQFNPESLSRNIQIPPRPTGATAREDTDAGEKPYEKITFTAHFSAADQLNISNPLAIVFGIGPQLAALEKMAFPTKDNDNSKTVDQAVDATADAISGADNGDATNPTPREKFPRILFIWGLTKVLPVLIESMSINEKQYDTLLNPIQAEVSLGLAVRSEEAVADDRFAKGALIYSTLAKDGQAAANLANSVQQVVEIIPF